jgi:hypothetical protein
MQTFFFGAILNISFTLASILCFLSMWRGSRFWKASQ